MTGALAPFSYLVKNVGTDAKQTFDNRRLDLCRIRLRRRRRRRNVATSKTSQERQRLDGGISWTASLLKGSVPLIYETVWLTKSL